MEEELDSILLSKYVIAKAQECCIPGMNVTKLQKFLYICYGAYLSLYKRRLLAEHPQAWPFGPVFPISKKKFSLFDYASTKLNVNDPEYSNLRESQEVNNVINMTFDTFGTWSAGKLSGWTHAEGGPWDTVINKQGRGWASLIPDEIILEYFNTIIS